MGKKTNQNKRITRSQNAGKSRYPPQMQSYIQVTTKVWQKDSHGLFDYEAPQDQYIKQVQKIFPFKKKIHKGQKVSKELENQARMFVCRNKQWQTKVIHENFQNRTEKPQNQLLGVCQILATRAKKGMNFKIRTALRLQNLNTALQRQALKLEPKLKAQILNAKTLSDNPQADDPNQSAILAKQKVKQQIKVFNPLICPFTVAKKFYRCNNNIEGYPLRAGNIIKFGRVQYLVVQMKNDKQIYSLRKTTDLKDVSGYEGIYEVQNNKQNDNQNHSKSQGYTPTCKVCLCGQQTADDVLISPCNCKGYCGLIHIQCLRQWINSKVKKQHQGMVASYNFNRFQCQICKMPFPQIIKRNNKKIEMMSIQKPENKPYIIIESINPPRSLLSGLREQERCLHVISAGQKNSLRVGRGHSCQIRISDISVSRAHAQIQLSDNRFLIKDTRSKFGTLILFDQQLTLNEKHPLLIQSGRCLYEFSIKKQVVQQQDENEQRDTQSENQSQMQNQANQRNS